jgi:3-methyladenine DNA glycosylase AlkD
VSEKLTVKLTAQTLIKKLNALGNKKDAVFLPRFFKTGPGEYSEGDVFIGLRVPTTRQLIQGYEVLALSEIQKLLQSKIHEHRLAALLISVKKFSKADELERQKIYEMYLKNTKHINNWDLVDSSAEHIVGGYLEGKNKSILKKLAKSKLLWERRIAILSTFHYIKKGRAGEAFEIAEMLLKDEHDLIHKAVGWMLREIGKRCSRPIEESFLKKHYKIMPRTMLRYAIEHFPRSLKDFYMA